MIRTLLLSASLLLFSCGKQDSQPTPKPTPSAQLVGKWKVETLGNRAGVSRSIYHCDPLDSECIEAMTYTFDDKGKVTIYMKGVKGTVNNYIHDYSLTDGGKKLLIQDDVQKLEERHNVVELTDKALKIDNYETFDKVTKKISTTDSYVLTMSRQ
jgi:hypothetical protein